MNTTEARGSTWSMAGRRMLAGLIDVGRTRLELATVELEEERLRIARLWIISAITLFLLFVGTVLAAAWVVVLCGPQNRTLVLGLLSASFLAAGALAAWWWQRAAARKPALLHATLQELEQDRRLLAEEGAL